jgi:hypothetical protein
MRELSQSSWRRIPLALLVLMFVFVGIGALGWLPASSTTCRSFVVLVGSFILSATLIRPGWFWNSGRARFGREIMGDRLYAGCLTGVALVLLYLGLLSAALDGCPNE